MGITVIKNEKIVKTTGYVIFFAILVPAIHFIFGFFLGRYLPNPLENLAWTTPVGLFIIVFGILILFVVIFQLYSQGKGLPISPVGPTILVTQGIFRFSRHPLYCAASLIFLGSGLLLYSFWLTVLAWPLFTLFYFNYARIIEEPDLYVRFASKYKNYARRVHIIPFFGCLKPFKSIAKNVLLIVNKIINRPLILQKGPHIFFIGYGLWCGLGVATGLYIFKVLFMSQGFSNSESNILILMATISGLLGSRLAGILSTKKIENVSFAQAFKKVKFISWGVLVGFVLMSIIFVVYTNKSPLIWFDISFTFLMIAHVFGRIGCTFYGCCHGVSVDSTFGLVYTQEVHRVVWKSKKKGELLYPIQLLSSFNGLLMTVLVLFLWAKVKVTIGLPSAILLVLYGLFRFNEEWFRFQEKMASTLLSFAQVYSIVIIFIGLGLLVFILPAQQEIYGQFTFSKDFYMPLISGAITALVFSYHYRKIGYWPNLSTEK